jgi:hydroxymethylbilane synthase
VRVINSTALSPLELGPFHVVPDLIRIATRESALAMCQTEMIAARLRELYPGLAVELVGMTTKGDQILDRPLAQVGGKGLFVKELENALSEDRADLAVHSLKDVPMVLPEGFALAFVAGREDPHDAFVSTRYASLADLPAGARVGTSSLRRECQLRRAAPHLTFHPLRGNVNTRLAKLDRGEYDAIILAAAGLRRLGFAGRIRATLPMALALPAIGQGILGLEHLSSRPELSALLAPFTDAATTAVANAERAVGVVVEGSCEVPIGAHATVDGDALRIEAFVGMPDGTRVIRVEDRGALADAVRIGKRAGQRLLDCGGRAVLAALPPAPK